MADFVDLESAQAAQGIGRATALLFAREGAKVVVSDLDESEFKARSRSWGFGKIADPGRIFLEKAQAVVDEIKKAGGQAIVVQGDVTAADFPKKLVKATVE